MKIKFYLLNSFIIFLFLISCSDDKEGSDDGSQLITAPTGVTASDGSYPDSVQISWDAVANASYYKIFRAESSEADFFELTDAIFSGTSAADNTIILDTHYWYKVSAVNSSGIESEFSTEDEGWAQTGALTIIEKTEAILNSYSPGNTTPALEYLSSDSFIQHNTSLQNGKQAVIDAISSGLYSNTTVNIVRKFSDSYHVITHSEYTKSTTIKVVFDVFRFKNGLIVEHWDNFQAKPAGTNQSGRTMTDGPVIVEDFGLTEQNKTLAYNFAQTCLVNGNWNQYATFVTPGVYLQHNPNFADGTSWMPGFQGTSLYTAIKHVFGQGNFVLVISFNNKTPATPKAAYDLWRFSNNKAVEHWDVVETITGDTNRKF